MTSDTYLEQDFLQLGPTDICGVLLHLTSFERGFHLSFEIFEYHSIWHFYVAAIHTD